MKNKELHSIIEKWAVRCYGWRGSLVRNFSFLIFIFYFSFFISPLTPLHAQKVQKGIASYYGKRATGRKTSSGERLHHDSLTCAHRTFPFGTLLKVTNPANGRVVVVKVNDRGPFGRGRIIDLSWGAAKVLGILSQGIASVVVERLNDSHGPFPDTTRVSIPELELAFPKTDTLLRPVWQSLDVQPPTAPQLHLPSSVSGR
jgi:rare lipoprotein A